MDEIKEKLNWQRLAITSGIVLLTAGVIGGGIWYYMNKNELAQTKSYNDTVSSLQKQINELKAEAKSASTSQATTTLPDTTQLDETAVKLLVTNFESAYKEAYLGQVGTNKATLLNTLFGYMTEPASPSDQDLKSRLISGKGTDGSLGGPTLFATGGTNRYPLSFTLDSISTNGTGYTVDITENKKYYANGANPPDYYTANIKEAFNVVKSNNSWLIDTYSNNSTAGKYGGFAY